MLALKFKSQSPQANLFDFKTEFELLIAYACLYTLERCQFSAWREEVHKKLSQEVFKCDVTTHLRNFKDGPGKCSTKLCLIVTGRLKAQLVRDMTQLANTSAWL
jgi:hypothetical protein